MILKTDYVQHLKDVHTSDDGKSIITDYVLVNGVRYSLEEYREALIRTINQLNTQIDTQVVAELRNRGINI